MRELKERRTEERQQVDEEETRSQKERGVEKNRDGEMGGGEEDRRMIKKE